MAENIYSTINHIKTSEVAPDNNQILDLQNKVNYYNELSSPPNIISVDGIIGPQTKSAIYDFEKNNQHILSMGKIENSQAASVAISSPQSSIKPVSMSPDISDNSLEKTTFDASNNNLIELSTKIIIDEYY